MYEKRYCSKKIIDQDHFSVGQGCFVAALTNNNYYGLSLYINRFFFKYKDGMKCQWIRSK